MPSKITQPNKDGAIAFIRFGSLSHVNRKLREILQAEFPQNELIELDIWQIVKSSKVMLAALLMNAARNNFGTLVLRRHDLVDSILHTPYAMRAIQRAVCLRLRQLPLLFSFQTQSFFSGMVAETPHFVYTDHTHLVNFRTPRWDTKKFWGNDWVEMERRLYASATRNFTWSGHVRESIIHDYRVPAERVIKVGVGSNAETLDALPASQTTRYSSQRILFIGVAWERKGGPDLLEAFASVEKHFPAATLRIVGCRPRIPSSAKNVHIVGRVGLDQIRAELLGASIFALPTRCEPFGIAVVEAMHFALPTITSDIEAMPEIVSANETGLLVAPYNPASLADALRRLLASPEQCQKMGEAGRVRARELFDWKQTGSRICSEIRASIAA